jgi:hypothetical protein
MPQKTGDDLSCPERVRSFCSTGGIRRVTLVTNSETTKSPPSTAFAIYVIYSLSHFPPHPSLSRLRQLLTKLLITTTLVI